MSFIIDDVVFGSSNGVNKIHGKIYIPNDVERIKGVIQFSHGMCEYFDKYKELASFFATNGYVFCGHDHIGHGDSVNSADERGFFADKDGYKYLIEDLHLMTMIIKKKFPNIPCFIVGHSMGTFIARCYAAKYGNQINGLILCGTIGPQWAVDGGIRLAEEIIKRKGKLYRSRKLDKLAFEFANLSFEPVKTKFDWTCSDENVVKAHLIDEKANFIFTASGFKDLFYLVKYCNDESVIKNTPKELPIFLISGDKDPVGEDGTGVIKVKELYKKIGIKDIDYKLYKDKRHEMFLETNKDEVFDDVLNWIEAVRFGEE